MGIKTERVILFDLYGLFMQVQTADGGANIERAAGLDELGVPRERFWDADAALRHDLDAGIHSPEEHAAAIQDHLGVRFPSVEAVAKADIASWQNPDSAMVEWLGELHGAGVRPALLSNIVEELKDQLLAREPWFEYFEPKIFSCDVGMAKPDAAIYELSLERINAVRAESGETAVTMHDVLFLDDNPANIDAASALGMHTHHFTGIDGAKAAVREFLAD